MILYLFLELIVVVWECVMYKKKMKEKIPGFEKATEEERRTIYGRKMAITGGVFLVIFLVILLGGISFGSNRHCTSGQALELAVCKECQDQYCADCGDGSESCQQCQTGYFVNGQGKCEDCDLEPYT